MLAYSYLCTQMMKDSARQQLFRKLKKENCFWSYDLSKMKYISDEALIEHVLLYLDIDDINKLFPLFGYKKVKRVWLDRVAPQGEMFRTFIFFTPGITSEPNALKLMSKASKLVTSTN